MACELFMARSKPDIAWLRARSTSSAVIGFEAKPSIVAVSAARAASSEASWRTVTKNVTVPGSRSCSS